MPKLIPSREELDDFIVLLKRYASASRASSARGAGGNPELTSDYDRLMLMLRVEASTRLATLNFRATYGWPESLSQALESLRSGEPSSRPSKSQNIKPIKGFIRVRVFNWNLPRLAMVNLDRSIEDIEAIVSVKSGALGEREPPPLRESERQIVETLRDRLELILAVFDKDNPGPLRGKKIAELSRLHYDAHLRADLSQLKSLGFLENTGLGYTRTDKPYPMS